jgi:hypothetical protein
MTVMVGSPADRYRRRHPDLAIFGVAPPDAVLVQVLIAHHFWRDVAHGTRALLAVVAFLAPVVEIVAVAPVNLVDIGREGFCAVHRGPLSGLDCVGTAGATRFSFSVGHGDDRAASVFAGLQAIVPRPQNRKRLVGGIHFEDLVPREPSHTNAHRTRRELNLHRAIVKVQKRETGVAVQTNRRRTDV